MALSFLGKYDISSIEHANSNIDTLTKLYTNIITNFIMEIIQVMPLNKRVV